MNQLKTFVSVGAGNVATHLVENLCKSGFNLIQVYSRTLQSARILAEPRGAGITNQGSEIVKNADFYLVSLPDNFLPLILDEIKTSDRLIFHTAGSFGLEVFGKRFSRSGVMYPLQTFSKDVAQDLSIVPFLIEAVDKDTEGEIRKIAGTISENVIVTDAETRKWIHLAAVFACNFTNHMIVLAEDILRNKKIDSSILKPLIGETFKKAITFDPAENQTGPAFRNDTAVMEKHTKMLRDQSNLQKIYTFTSESIQLNKSGRSNKSNS